MFRVLIFIIFFGLIYVLMRKEKNRLKYVSLAYFALLTIVFFIGHTYITSTYQLFDNPIVEGFDKHFNWVSYSALFYLVPLIILILYKLFKYMNKTLKNTGLKVLTLVASTVGLMVIGYVMLFIFVLTFYGFAP